jgi:hypothetical protein
MFYTSHCFFLDFCTNHSTKEVEEMKGKMYGHVPRMSDERMRKYEVFATTMMTKHKSMLFAENVYKIHMHRCMHTTMMISCQPTPLLPVLALFFLLYMIQSFFLLTWRSCFFYSWCEYPSTLVPGLLSNVLHLLLHPPQGTP